MKNIDWVRKLTSRKFWLAIANFVSMIIIATGGTQDKATQIVALIMAGAGIVGYVIGEGLADSGETYYVGDTISNIENVTTDEEANAIDNDA